MNVLVIGGGGREHALAWKIANDSRKPKVFCAPGNAGTVSIATNLPIAVEDMDAIIDWAISNRPNLTVIGPEAPLCAGLTDLLQEHDLRVFGPSQSAARLEGSKVFAKELMRAAGVPTGAFETFTDVSLAIDFVNNHGTPIVVKADGLAAGKGVFVCKTISEAEIAIQKMMVAHAFGNAGKKILVEEYLHGEEASILALTDGENIVMLASSQDHKRTFDGDLGPNTGGMGAYSPAPIITNKIWPMIRENIFDRLMKEMKKQGIKYRGILYAGLMINDGVPRVLEFNCRFGDPEAQVILPRIQGDFLPALDACVDGSLENIIITWDEKPCVCIVMASGGYPGSYDKGKIIHGLDEAIKTENTIVFHAGTSQQNGNIVTSGGRVLNISTSGPDLQSALHYAYQAAALIHFDGAQYRTDIGLKAMNRVFCKKS